MPFKKFIKGLTRFFAPIVAVLITVSAVPLAAAEADACRDDRRTIHNDVKAIENRHTHQRLGGLQSRA
ncbi:MAG TPA: hypothetical protein VN316_01120 [candidate division Zixibacteria bacterium]|nr:hypothetical protein [candidate division Zixibacteria bacterium]